MNKSLLTAFAATLMLVTALAPTAVGEASGEKQTIQGGNGLVVKFLGGFGFSTCTTGIPCEHPDIATFNTSGWNTEPGNDNARLVTFWANWARGVFGPGDTGGYEMIACSDRNDDSICTNADGTDDYASTYSNRAVLGVEEAPCDKDDKDCGDNTDAEIVMCIRADDGGAYDDVHVFIGQWADAGLGGNVGSGISVGTYDVYMDPGSFAGC